LFEAAEIRLDLSRRRRVVLLDGEFEQLAGVVQPLRQFVEGLDDPLELRAFAAERLGALGLVPDVGLFQFAPDLGEAFRLAVVVKDTSSTQRCVRRGR
jgi:hypothetical protein